MIRKVKAHAGRFGVAGMGGTFDHLHEGHRLLLTTALKVAEKVVFGLASDELLKSKGHAEFLQSYEERKRHIIDFVKTFTDPSRVSFIPLRDPFGPAITSKEIEVLAISFETLPNAQKINEMREQNGLPPVVFAVIPLLKNRDGGKLSSTEIRAKLAANVK